VGFTVLVEEENEPPVVRIILPEGGNVSLDNDFLIVEWVANDVNGDPISVTVEVLNGSVVLATVTDLSSGPRNVTLNASEHSFPRDTDLVVRVTARELWTDELFVTTTLSSSFLIPAPEPEPDPDPDPDPKPPPEPELAVEEAESRIWLYAVLALIIALVVGGILFFALRGTGSVDMAVGHAPMVPIAMTTCPQCGGGVDYNNAFKRPYCQHCDRYY
jgi:hypothetical protein